MIPADHPYACAMGVYPAGLPADGWGLAGRFTAWTVDQDSTDNAYVFQWIVETTGDNDDGWAVFVYENGTFKERVRGTDYTYMLPDTLSRARLSFLLLPDEAGYTSEMWVDERNLSDLLKLTWDVDGEVKQVEIYKNDAGDDEVNQTTPVKTFNKATAVVEGTANAAVSGTWDKAIEQYATITITIVYAGTTGTAQWQWSWGSYTGNVETTQGYYREVANGIRLKFTDGASWTYLQTFTIAVRFVEEYTTGELANGEHTFQVATLNESGKKTWSDTETYTLSAVPDSPSFISYTYSAGTGQVTVFWQMPDDTGVDTVRVHRNYPEDGMGAEDATPYIMDNDVSAGQVFWATVYGLQEGVNRIWARVSNNGEREENWLASRCEIVLDSSLNEVVWPHQANSYKAEVQVDDTITWTVFGDATSTSFNLYHDNKTGTVDYDTPYDTLANPQDGANQKLTKPDLYLPDGDYLIAVRAVVSGNEETNTDTKAFTVDTTVAPQATSLALEVV